MSEIFQQSAGRIGLAAGIILTALYGLVVNVAFAADPVAGGYPEYRPPLRGAPATRIGGGTRGPGDDTPEIYVLVPEHTGRTSRDQPVLYWYLSHPIKARHEFVLMAEKDYDPLVEVTLAPVNSGGIQSIALAGFDIRLQPDVLYRWSVAIVMDEEQRSSDILASGMIEYARPPTGILTRIADASGEELIRLYAGAGLWYDALQSLDELISSGSDVDRLIQVRASLLEQVGLKNVAAATGGP